MPASTISDTILTGNHSADSGRLDPAGDTKRVTWEDNRSSCDAGRPEHASARAHDDISG